MSSTETDKLLCQKGCDDKDSLYKEQRKCEFHNDLEHLDLC